MSDEMERMGRAMAEADEKKAAEIAALRIKIKAALDEGSEFRHLVKRLRYLEESPCANN